MPEVSLNDTVELIRMMMIRTATFDSYLPIQIAFDETLPLIIVPVRLHKPNTLRLEASPYIP